MRIALCTLDGAIYQASDFHDATGFEAKKRDLVCPECNGPAFYRGITRNGREACFGARPHAEGCTLATPEHDGAAMGQEDGDHEIFTTGQRIILDLNYGTPIATVGAQQAGATTATDNTAARADGGINVRDTMHRRMSSILRCLINSDEFRRSNQSIQVSDVGEYTVADLFVNFADVTDAHIGGYHGFWGMIPDARRDVNGRLWFNSGGRENMSVPLDQQLITETYQRFHIEEDEDVAGAYILVLGRLRVGPTGKRYVPIGDPSHFTLRLAR